MSEPWFGVVVPATVGVATAIYATGGRAALARRAIKQELEIAQLMPEGAPRDALERVAQEKAVLYASRWIGPQPLRPRGHLAFLALAVVGFGAAWVASHFADVAGDHGWIEAFLSLALVLGLSAFTMAIIGWGVLVWTADNAKTRADTVAARKARVDSFLADGTRQ